ncbi:MAG TPA: YbaK/EbsC family protein [Chloroflexia bacterium]|nr:YbaK/EbsC family protein [Chloroflexia bacterium]
MASGPERVQAALDALELEIQVLRVPGSAKTAGLAAEAVGCPVGAIVKSLVFVAGGTPVLVLCPGDRRVDPAKLAAQLGVDVVAMAPPDIVRAATGYAIGGVPPLGHATRLPILLERALLAWPTVYGAAGAPDALFPIAPATLAAVTGAQVVDVT